MLTDLCYGVSHFTSGTNQVTPVPKQNATCCRVIAKRICLERTPVNESSPRLNLLAPRRARLRGGGDEGYSRGLFAGSVRWRDVVPAASTIGRPRGRVAVSDIEFHVITPNIRAQKSSSAN
eukprot:5411420-Pyramimonas_sp.AAC.1